MSSTSDVDPTPPLSPSTWQHTAPKLTEEEDDQPAATVTSVHDRINLFETNHNTNSKESSSDPLHKDSGSSRSHHHHHHHHLIRSSSVGARNNQEQEEYVFVFDDGQRMSRGDQELNLRLQMKADELERIFAEHKRRIYGDRNLESSSRDVRGRLYERYMEKRDARRREEWGRNREKKEAEMRAMRESVDRSRAQFMASYEGEEKLTSSTDRSSTTKKDQKTVSSVLAEDEEDTQSSDGSSKSINSKIFTSRSMSSSTSRIPGSALAKPSSEAPISRPMRGSVPNSDFRKENTKPSAGISKASIHSQLSIIPRSKSTSAGTNYFKEEKPPRSSSLRKSSVAPLTPLRTTKEQSGSKPFLKKGAGVGSSRLRSSSDHKEEQDAYNTTSYPQEASVDSNASLDSPCGSTSSWFSQEGTRVRKKWGTAQMPFLVSDGSTKGLKRFLHFGKKSKGVESQVSSVSGADYDADMASEQIRDSSMSYHLHSHNGFSFSEGLSLHEQVKTPRRSVPTPVNIKSRKDHLSEISPKSPRSFFSLSAFRNKGVESKLR